MHHLSRSLGSFLAISAGAALSVPAGPALVSATGAPTADVPARLGCCVDGIQRNFDLETPELIFGGYGTVDGVVGFQSRRRADVAAAVTDWCDNNPGDGLGAGLYVDIAFGDGSGKLEYLFGDFNGCTNSNPSPVGSHSVPNPNDKRIIAIQMLLCYEDPDVVGVACETQKRSRVIENPHN